MATAIRGQVMDSKNMSFVFQSSAHFVTPIHLDCLKVAVLQLL